MAAESALKRRSKDAPERRLIEAAQRDPACFARLYEENFERVYAFVARRVRDRDQLRRTLAMILSKQPCYAVFGYNRISKVTRNSYQCARF